MSLVRRGRPPKNSANTKPTTKVVTLQQTAIVEATVRKLDLQSKQIDLELKLAERQIIPIQETSKLLFETFRNLRDAILKSSKDLSIKIKDLNDAVVIRSEIDQHYTNLLSEFSKNLNEKIKH